MRTALGILLLAFPAARGEAGVVVCNVLDYEVRLDGCAGPNTGFEWNISRACEKFPNRTIVRCHRECQERNKVGLCKKCGWTEKQRAACTTTGDAVKLKECTGAEGSAAVAAFQEARGRIGKVVSSLNAVSTKGKPLGEKAKFDIAKVTAARIRGWLDKDRKLVCHDDGGGCSGASAFAIPLTGGAVGIRLCPSFFKYSKAAGAGVIIHEASHSCCGTTDQKYYTGGKQPSSADNWPIIADTYNYWSDHGFCIPSAGGKCI